MAAACAGPSDARLVVAGQRILRLTGTETINTVRYLINDAEAAALLSAGILPTDETNPAKRNFLPSQETSINAGNYQTIASVASHVHDYVLANFATATGCTTATDACATAYLDKLAAKAYRRQLTPDERSRFTALYTKLRTSQTVNGYEVTFTVEEATSYAVEALLSSPQMLWRWELGDPAMASTSPAGIPLTDQELATHLAFFMTDQPPDDTLRAAANAGTLRANLAAHVEALLASQTARDWLRTIMETYFLINKLPDASVDPAKFPIFTPSLVSDLGIEARKFLDNVLWSGNLTDLLTVADGFPQHETGRQHLRGFPCAGRDGDELRPDHAAGRPAVGVVDERCGSHVPRPLGRAWLDGAARPVRCRGRALHAVSGSRHAPAG